MAPRFLFVRHGQATHNTGAELYGDIAYEDPRFRDASLTERGRLQALEAGRAIVAQVGNRQVHVYSSPSTRCIQTAECILAAGLNPLSRILHDSLLERLLFNHISNERKAVHVLQELYPDWDTRFLPTFPPCWSQDEPVESVRVRMACLFEYLKKIYAYTNTLVLVVTHHDAIDALFNADLQNAQIFEPVLREEANSF